MGTRRYVFYDLRGKTMLVYEFHEPLRCVKCGIGLTGNNIIQAGEQNLAPCCGSCQPAVYLELMANAAVWPNDWYGHWYKTASDNRWMQI